MYTFPNPTAMAASPIKPPFLTLGFLDIAKSWPNTFNNRRICMVLFTAANSLTILDDKSDSINQLHKTKYDQTITFQSPELQLFSYHTFYHSMLGHTLH